MLDMIDDIFCYIRSLNITPFYSSKHDICTLFEWDCWQRLSRWYLLHGGERKFDMTLLLTTHTTENFVCVMINHKHLAPVVSLFKYKTNTWYNNHNHIWQATRGNTLRIGPNNHWNHKHLDTVVLILKCKCATSYHNHIWTSRWTLN